LGTPLSDRAHAVCFCPVQEFIRLGDLRFVNDVTFRHPDSCYLPLKNCVSHGSVCSRFICPSLSIAGVPEQVLLVSAVPKSSTTLLSPGIARWPIWPVVLVLVWVSLVFLRIIFPRAIRIFVFTRFLMVREELKYAKTLRKIRNSSEKRYSSSIISALQERRVGPAYPNATYLLHNYTDCPRVTVLVE
jgi:hypothetical protein